ncbi:MAG: hypothetical protein ACI81V_000829 [Lentimonas sp.]|jgi:hypothetical protein
MKFKTLLITLSAATLVTLCSQAKPEAGERTRPEGSKPNPAEIFRKLDTDGSKSISKAEIEGVEKAKHMTENFDRIDANGDGELTPDEMRAHRESMPGKGGERGKGEGMKALDADQSRSISKEEAANAPRLAEAFDNIDANGDGELTPDELRAHHQAHGGKGKKQRGEEE